MTFQHSANSTVARAYRRPAGMVLTALSIPLTIAQRMQLPWHGSFYRARGIVVYRSDLLFEPYASFTRHCQTIRPVALNLRPRHLRSDIITLFSSSETRYKPLYRSHDSPAAIELIPIPTQMRPTKSPDSSTELPSHALQRTAPTLTVVTSSPDLPPRASLRNSLSYGTLGIISTCYEC